MTQRRFVMSKVPLHLKDDTVGNVRYLTESNRSLLKT